MSDLIELTDWATKEPCYLDSTRVTEIMPLPARDELHLMEGRKLPAIPLRTKVVCGSEVFVVVQTPFQIYTAILKAERKKKEVHEMRLTKRREDTQQ